MYLSLELQVRRKLFVVRLISKARPGGAGIRALQTDEESRRFRSKSRNYPPRSPPGSLNPDLEDDNALPLLRGTSRRSVLLSSLICLIKLDKQYVSGFCNQKR